MWYDVPDRPLEPPKGSFWWCDGEWDQRYDDEYFDEWNEDMDEWEEERDMADV